MPDQTVTPEQLNIPAWKCKTCGCLWRDNLDQTVSLFDAQQKSCAACEHSPTAEACEIHWLALSRLKAQEAWQDEHKDALIAAYWLAQDLWSSQCFCYTTMPEASRRTAHEVVRDGLNELSASLGRIVHPWLTEEYWEAVRAAKAEKMPLPPAPADSRE